MEVISDNSHQPRKIRGLGIGILLIAIGTILLGINFGWIHSGMKYVLFSWPAILIVVGLFQLRKKFQLIWGTILVLTGTFFIIPRIVRAFPDAFPGIGENFAGVYWPFLLIVAGVIIIVFKFIFPQPDWTSHWKNKAHVYKSYGYVSGGFEKSSVFSDGEHIILDPVFKGGEVNAVFGGLRLDLRRTSLPEGDTYLKVDAVFGGVTLFIPGDWVVITNIETVFGGFSDHRRIVEPTNPTRRLIITGDCVFAGGEIKG